MFILRYTKYQKCLPKLLQRSSSFPDSISQPSRKNSLAKFRRPPNQILRKIPKTASLLSKPPLRKKVARRERPSRRKPSRVKKSKLRRKRLTLTDPRSQSQHFSGSTIRIWTKSKDSTLSWATLKSWHWFLKFGDSCSSRKSSHTKTYTRKIWKSMTKRWRSSTLVIQRRRPKRCWRRRTAKNDAVIEIKLWFVSIKK